MPTYIGRAVPFFLLLLCLSSTSASAQWQFIGPAKTFPTGYAISGSTRYLATTEGIFERPLTGDRWIEITDNLPERAIESLVRSDNGLFVHLGADGFWQRVGNAWVERSNNAGGANVASGTSLYALFADDVWTSTDDGVSWQQTATQPTTNNSDPKAIAVLGDYVFVVDGAFTFRSSDGGSTWEQTPLDGGAVLLHAQPEKGALYAVVLVGGGKGLLRSLDSGTTWTRIYNPGLFNNVGSVATSGDNIMISVGANRFRSDDFGVTFSAPIDQLPLPSTLNSAPVALFGDENGFLLSLAFGTYFSTDGKSWDGLSEGLTATTDIKQALNHKGTLFAVSSDAIAYTAPSNLEWEPYCIVIPDFNACYNGGLLSGIAQTNTFLYVFFGNANVRSRDGGLTFERTSGIIPGAGIPNPGPRFFGSGDRVYAMSGTGVYMMTDEDNSAWTKVLDASFSNTEQGAGVITAYGERIVVNVTNNSYVSVDGGQNWVTTNDRNGNGAVQGNRLWVTTGKYTEDGGANFTTLNNAPATTDIHAVGSVLVVGGRDGIHFSRDDGTTWVDITDNFPSGQVPSYEANYLFNDEEYLYASLKYNIGSNVDQGEGLWRRSLSDLGITTAIEGAVPTPDIALDLFPNPIQGRLAVAFSLEEASQATVVVYDLLGRQVAQLASGLSSAGQHTLEFNTDTLAPGMYLARLTTATSTVTKRFVVAR